MLHRIHFRFAHLHSYHIRSINHLIILCAFALCLCLSFVSYSANASYQLVKNDPQLLEMSFIVKK